MVGLLVLPNKLFVDLIGYLFAKFVVVFSIGLFVVEVNGLFKSFEVVWGGFYVIFGGTSVVLVVLIVGLFVRLFEVGLLSREFVLLLGTILGYFFSTGWFVKVGSLLIVPFIIS